MKSSKFISILFLLSIVLSSGIVNAFEKKEKPGQDENWNTFQGDGYTIQYPSDWQSDDSGMMGTSMILFAPRSSDTDQFQENVNLIIQDLRTIEIDLDAYAKISTDQVKSLITNSEIEVNKRLGSGEDEYHMMVYTGDQGKFKLKYVQYYWVRNEKAFVLTFTSEQDQFEDYRETGLQILDSFSLN